VDERDEHALLHLLDGLVLVRYGPMRQYCSGGSRIWSSIHPLPGRLQQRVVEEEQEPPPGREHPGHLGDRLVDVVDVLEHQAGDHGVEGGVGERQGGGPAAA
jgi:hypothetical protein